MDRSQMSNEELRMAIAERKGWTEIRWQFEQSRGGTAHYWLRGRKPGGPHDADEVPNWPEDIRDAWELVEELEKAGHAIRLSNKAGGGFWWCYFYGDGLQDPCMVMQAKPASRAISLAYLSATEPANNTSKEGTRHAAK